MNYFSFTIGVNADGSRETYSPAWHGTMVNCPKKTTVLLFDDENGFGIAETESEITQPEIKEITESEAKKIIKDADINNPKIFKEDKLKNRDWGKVVKDGN